ncbi:MAG: ABC transporter ATP-binding protein [Gemmataceae bacterium]
MPHLIELHQITRRFGEFVALSDITLTLPAGRIGLLGPNGAGKSTLLKILLGLVPPSSGEGRVLDQPIGRDHDDTTGRELRRRIGFMPEAEALVPGLSGIEYVALAGELCGLPRRQAERRAHEVLSFLQLDDARYRPVEQYSAGMKQRAKLAQALVHDPAVLLLDEPTSGLDPAGRDAMLKLINDLGTEHGKSVILSTHLLADVQAVCEHVVVMAQGTVRGSGRVDELCSKRDDRFRLRVQGDGTKFKEDLIAEGIEFLGETAGGEWRIRVPAGWSNLAFFKLADLNDCAIRALVRDDETLEELFLRFVRNPLQNPTS